MAVTVDKSLPDFAAPATGGEFRLADQRGRTVVLYFYPKDNTPGCTTEGLEFAAAEPKFRKANAMIVGASRDSVRSHEGFKTKMGFPFELISDTDEALCSLFEVIKMKNMYGKQVRGIERSTFLIDGEGVLRREWRAVKVPGHAGEVLQSVKSLP